MILVSIIVLSYGLGVMTPFLWFAIDWQRDKRRLHARHFFGEGT